MIHCSTDNSSDGSDGKKRNVAFGRRKKELFQDRGKWRAEAAWGRMYPNVGMGFFSKCTAEEEDQVCQNNVGAKFGDWYSSRSGKAIINMI